MAYPPRVSKKKKQKGLTVYAEFGAIKVKVVAHEFDADSSDVRKQRRIISRAVKSAADAVVSVQNSLNPY